MRPLAFTPEVEALLSAGAPVAVGVSGGKDSHALAWAMAQFLRDYRGPKVLIHADLGAVEWQDSFPACQRIADRIGWELIETRRPAGGMMERWEQRWKSSIDRYIDLRLVSLVLPWSTPALRFCTSELKVDPISSALKKRFGRVPILNVTGVRAEESTARAKQPVSSKGAKLPPGSVMWRPLHAWLLQDVWDAIRASGTAAHEAYGTYGSSRVSCRFCILASEADLRASLRDPAAVEIYRRMCNLELSSGFSFQGKWLSALAPELLDEGGQRLLRAVQMSDHRKKIEIPLSNYPHLRFTKGWPHSLPTLHESHLISDMRKRMCHLYGWDSPYLGPVTVRDRYQELLDLKAAKEAA